MKKKLLSIILTTALAVCLAALFIACGEKGTDAPKPPPEGTTYTVTYVTNGGNAIAPDKVEAGKSITLPVPTKTGSDFVAWYETSDFGGTAVVSPYKPTKNVTLYAKWTEKSGEENYYVQFDVNGGQPIIEYTTKKSGETVSEPTAPTRVGYEFDGWYTDVGCTKAATFPYTVTDNVDFYAGWTSNRLVTVNFRLCESRTKAYPLDYGQDIMKPQTIVAGEKLEQPEDPEDIQYSDSGGNVHTLKFSYWNFRPTYQNDWTRAVLFPLYNTDVPEITLYAVYVELSQNGTYAKLTIHPENGEKETVMYGEKGKAVGISPLDATDTSPFYSDFVEPFREGYSATGYYKTREFDSQHVYAVPFMLENDANDVYIRWERRADVTVTFNGASKQQQVTVPYGGKVERPANPSRAGYTFDGWLASPFEQAVEEYRWDFDHDRAKRNIVLRAKWIKTATVITFETGCSIKRNPIAVGEGTRINELPAISRNENDSEYAFLGWCSDEGLNNMVVLPYYVTGDATFYAKWSAPIDVSLFEFLPNGVDYSVRVKDSVRGTIEGTVTVPSSYKGVTVSVVDNNGFKNCTKITEMILPNTVTYLYNSAFAGCTALRKVVISDDMIQIGQNVFNDCENLEEINFPQNKKMINISADIFRYCPKMWSKLETHNDMYYWGTAFLGNGYYVKGEKVTDATTKKLTVRDGTTIVASRALYYMSALEEFTLADSVQYLTWWAFPLESASSLKKLNLSSSYMATSLIYWTKSLETITVPTTNKYFKMVNGCLMYTPDNLLVVSTVGATSIPSGTVIIGEQSFRAKNIDTVTIPDTVTTIRREAFAECAFKTIVIPDSVGILDSSAFKDCKNMEQIKLGEKTNLQTKDLFGSMNKLNTLEVSPKNAAMIAECSVLYNRATGDIIHAAPAYKGALTLRDSVTSIPYGMFTGTYTTFTLSDNITEIEEGAFDWAKIDKLVIGKNVPKIGANYLLGGQSVSNYVKSVELSPENENMVLRDGVLYSADMTELLLTPTTLKTLVIPDSVTSVDYGTWLMGLDSLTIGAGISLSHAYEIFYGTEDKFYPALMAAKSVTVSPASAELTEFNGIIYTKNKQRIVYIPYNYTGALVLPKEMSSLDQAVFAYTTFAGYENGEWAGAKVEFTSLSVEQDSALTWINHGAFWGGVVLYGEDTDRPYWVENNFFIRDFVGILSGAVDLTDATHLEGVGKNSFERTNIVSVALPQSCKTIGFAAFANCSELETVTGDFADMEIEGMAFNRSSKLYDADGWLVFDGVLVGCDDTRFTEGTELVVPNTVRAIGKSAVYVNVRSITIPTSVETVAEQGIWPNGNGKFVIYLKATAVPAGFAKNEEGEHVWYSDRFRSVALVLGCNSENPVGSKFYTDPTTGLFYELTVDGNARLISDATATAAWAGDVALPEKITCSGKQYTLVAIEDYALYGHAKDEQGNYYYLSKDVTSLTLPDTVTEIGSNAVNGLISVEEFVVPDSVTTLRRSAFATATFKKITIGRKVTVLPDYTFNYCNALETVVLRGAVTEIGENCFNYCKLLKDIDLSHVTVVGASAFSYCESLAPTSIGGLTSIGKSAFFNCKSLTSVTFADGLETIPFTAFCGSGITSAALPATVKLIESSAFRDCPALATVTVSGGTLTIELRAFEGCGALVSFSTQGKIVSIGNDAFGDYSCDMLETFAATGGIGSIGNGAFKGCSALVSIPFTGVTSVGSNAFKDCTSLTEAVFDSVVTVGSYAFSGCDKIERAEFGDSLTSIGTYAFEKCVKLQSVDLGAGDGITVDVCAFYGLSSLTTLVCGGSFACIGNYAFYNCTALTAKNLTLKGYGDNASIGMYAFMNTRIEKLVLDGIKTVEKQAFYGIGTLTEVLVRNYDGMTIGQWSFGSTGIKLFEFDAQTAGTVKRIVEQAFYNISSVGVVKLCNVQTVDNFAFRTCPNLTVHVPFAQGNRPSGWGASWNYENTATVVYAESTGE